MQEQRPFRFGVISETVQPGEAWLDHVRRVEALGYDTLLIRDHLVPDFFGDQLAPVPALLAAALMTTRLRVGTMVLDNDFRHPALLAKEAATVDYLSGGRLELGLGAGWLRAEYERAGIAYDPAGTRIDRLEEALAVLNGLFAGEPLAFSGRHYRIDGLTLFPRPCQRPRPPILIGGGKRRVLTLAGREADIVGILTTSVASGVVEDFAEERLPAAVERKLSWVREGAGARFEQLELSFIPTVILTDDRVAAAERLIAKRSWHGITPDDVLGMPSMLIGTTAEIVEQLLERRARYGFSYYVVSDQALDTFAPVVAKLGTHRVLW